ILEVSGRLPARPSEPGANNPSINNSSNLSFFFVIGSFLLSFDYQHDTRLMAGHPYFFDSRLLSMLDFRLLSCFGAFEAKCPNSRTDLFISLLSRKQHQRDAVAALNVMEQMRAGRRRFQGKEQE